MAGWLRESTLKAQERVADGIVEAREWGNGKWYVESRSGAWKEIDHRFWCELCEAGMGEAALSAHLDGQRHRKSLAARDHAANARDASLGASGSAPVTGDRAREQAAGARDAGPAAARPAPAAGDRADPVEKWQAMEADGRLRCLACNKYSDSTHEATEEHARRVASYVAKLEEPEYQYYEPDVLWLAWVPCPEWGKGFYLKCLLCDKWITDLEGTDPRGYDGQHGPLSDKNQKAHGKKMSKLEELMQDTQAWNAMLAERARWHQSVEFANSPARTCMPCTVAVPSRATTCTPCKPAAPSRATTCAPRKAAAPELPKGWQEAWSSYHECQYFFSEFGDSQWDRPTAPARPPVPKLPDGWQAAWSAEEECYYFYHYTSDASQWELPTESAAAVAGPRDGHHLQELKNVLGALQGSGIQEGVLPLDPRTGRQAHESCKDRSFPMHSPEKSQDPDPKKVEEEESEDEEVFYPVRPVQKDGLRWLEDGLIQKVGAQEIG